MTAAELRALLFFSCSDNLSAIYVHGSIHAESEAAREWRISEVGMNLKCKVQILQPSNPRSVWTWVKTISILYQFGNAWTENIYCQ